MPSLRKDARRLGACPDKRKLQLQRNESGLHSSTFWSETNHRSPQRWSDEKLVNRKEARLELSTNSVVASPLSPVSPSGNSNRFLRENKILWKPISELPNQGSFRSNQAKFFVLFCFVCLVFLPLTVSFPPLSLRASYVNWLVRFLVQGEGYMYSTTNEENNNLSVAHYQTSLARSTFTI